MLKNSAAMLYLQELKLKKALGRFHAENLSKGAYTYSYTQQVSTGAKLPSMGYIISLRHMIPPALCSIRTTQSQKMFHSQKAS